MSLAQRVRDYRYSKGWGPDELANRAAISRTALYQIESGKTELPRAGTLRRIALALDVSMETLLGNAEALSAGIAAAGPVPGVPASSSPSPVKSRPVTEWFPSEGAPLSVHSHRNGSKFDLAENSRFGNEGSRFGVEYSGPASNPVEPSTLLRERELVLKLHEILSSPLGEPVARILEETFRLLPQARMAASYE